MTPGFNRLRGTTILPTELLPRMYTSWDEHLQIHFIDDAPMFTSPRDAAVPRLRWDLVVRVRREIEAGTYDTPEKWDIALSRLQEDLENETYTSDEQPV